MGFFFFSSVIRFDSEISLLLLKSVTGLSFDPPV